MSSLGRLAGLPAFAASLLLAFWRALAVVDRTAVGTFETCVEASWVTGAGYANCEGLQCDRTCRSLYTWNAFPVLCNACHVSCIAFCICPFKSSLRASPKPVCGTVLCWFQTGSPALELHPKLSLSPYWKEFRCDFGGLALGYSHSGLHSASRCG